MSKLKDLTGKICGFLYVIERLPSYVQKNNGRKRTRWLTYCLLCGNTYIADGSHLLHGNVVSCGCLKNAKAAERMHATKGQEKKNSRTKDLTGQIFVENVQALYSIPKINNKAAWRCKCLLCGTEFDARANHLIRGLIRSCGCVHSFAEREIRNYLNEHKIRYETEYSFNDLRSETNNAYRFDFAFLDKTGNLIALLEYQGEQHDPKKTSEFGKQQRDISDRAKKQYCKDHDIPLYEIWYYQDLKKELDKILENVLHVNPVLEEKID